MVHCGWGITALAIKYGGSSHCAHDNKNLYILHAFDSVVATFFPPVASGHSGQFIVPLFGGYTVAGRKRVSKKGMSFLP